LKFMFLTIELAHVWFSAMLFVLKANWIKVLKIRNP
jgi:hypothetical protein